MHEMNIIRCNNRVPRVRSLGSGVVAERKGPFKKLRTPNSELQTFL